MYYGGLFDTNGRLLKKMLSFILQKVCHNDIHSTNFLFSGFVLYRPLKAMKRYFIKKISDEVTTCRKIAWRYM